MNPSTNPTPDGEEQYAPVDKWSKSTGFLPVTAGSNPAGSTTKLSNLKAEFEEYTAKNEQFGGAYSKIGSCLVHLCTLVLIAWGQAVEPSLPPAKKGAG